MIKWKRGITRVLGSPRRRWKDEIDIIYLLNMPLSPRPVFSTLQVVKKVILDDQLGKFAVRRENEDESWCGKDYQSVIRSRIERGHWCYLAVLEGQPIGIINAAQGTYFIDAVRFRLRLPDDVVAIYDAYTSPMARGQGFFTPLWNSAVNDCLEMGFQECWGFLMPHNLVSIRIHKKLGLRHIFRMITLRQKWGLRWHHCENLEMSSDELLVNLSVVEKS
jgi:GNAT superfamily N-acetyltransferase